MSWFGETFGDSLSSLKGQITKITKEVLADDGATNSEKSELGDDLVKELEALCESKDIEIASLRDELNQVKNQCQSQIGFFSGENKSEGNETTCDNSDFLPSEVKNELFKLRQERDHLNSCLDELQSEYQVNLSQVVAVRDKYKSELGALKKEYECVKDKLDDVLIKQVNHDESEETNLLRAKISDLQSQLEKERDEYALILKKEKENQTVVKEQLEKLIHDVEVVKKDKNEIENDRNKILNENKDLRNKLIEKDKENGEKEIKVKLLLNENEELLKNCQNQEFIESKLSGFLKNEKDIEQQLKNILQLLNINIEKLTEDQNSIKLIKMIEDKLHEKSAKLNENWEELISKLETEIMILKEENRNLQNNLKISTENNQEMERNYKEEILFLKESLSDMKTEQQNCIIQSKTGDVKRLEEEIVQCKSVILDKNNEITEYLNSLSNAKEELENLKTSYKTVEEELLSVKDLKTKLEEEIVILKNTSEALHKENVELKEKLAVLESEKTNLNQMKSELQSTIVSLKEEIANLMSDNERVKILQGELDKTTACKSETDKIMASLQNDNVNLKQELENMKAQVIVKESSLVDLMKANNNFQDEINKLQCQNNELVSFEKELKKWKDASIDLQIQQDYLIARKEELEYECSKLKSELEMSLGAKNAEIEQLKLANKNLMQSCNELHQQLENKMQVEHLSATKENELQKKCQEQSELILQLEEEISELKVRVQKFQEQMKLQMSQVQSQSGLKEDVQHHRRSRSAVDTDSSTAVTLGIQNEGDLTLLKQALQQEQSKYQLLQHQFNEISNKEATARKEFERLKQHLIEVEDHYTEEAVENEKIINDLKSKLVAAEEQLHNSSTLYTSLKVRDNQHLESLQSQIRMVSAQRDDLQAKLSAAEDEVQKHKASLMSLQIVLEQFQQDKETEVEQVAMKYEKQLHLNESRFRDLELEIQGLKNQLAEAKNGLNAASRLGEQLEKKSQQVAELEESRSAINSRLAELEKSLENANQGNNGKIDKSLIKNLVVGYILSKNADRRSQVLKIMASVLDFDQEERNKMGVDANRSGWLANILHPQGESSPSSQSLSEAFIKFLENESRPQPQVKLLPEQLEASASKTSRTSPKPSGHLSELMLPTFSSSQENDSSIILKNVLKNS